MQSCPQEENGLGREDRPRPARPRQPGGTTAWLPPPFTAGVWEDPEGVLTQYGAVCIERPPAPSAGGAVAMGAAIAPGGAVKQGLGSLQEALERPDNVLSRCRQHIHVVRDVARTNISSTLVRGELRAGRSVRYLVPDGVERYLERHPDVYAGCGR